MPNIHELLLECLFDGVYFVNLQGEITYWNEAAERITGYSRQDVLGRKCCDNLLRHIDHHGAELCEHGCPIRMTMSDLDPREADVFLHHKDGRRLPVSLRVTPIMDKQGQALGVAEVFSDNTDKRNLIRRLEEVRREALTDALTGVGNRRYAQLHLDNCLRELRNTGLPFGVLMVDLDRFKAVNDTYGHAVGDRVLAAVAGTIKSCLRLMDVVARWGGEEFVVITNNATLEGMAVLAERIRAFVAGTWLEHATGPIRVTISIGGALMTQPRDVDELVARADANLYACKNSRRNSCLVC